MQRFWVFYRTLLLNLIFAAYLVFLQPTVLQRLEATKGYRSADPLMGVLLLALPLLEVGGVYLKHPASAYYFHHCTAKRLRDDPMVGGVGVGIFLCAVILHLGMSVFLAIMAFQVLGVRTGEGGALLPLIGLTGFIFLVIFKEVLFMVLWYNPFGGSTDPPAQLTPKLLLRDGLGDLLLLIFSAVGYTALWDATISPDDAGVGAGVLFLFIYPLLRSIYLFQEIFLEKDRWAKVWSWMSFVFVLAAAMASV